MRAKFVCHLSYPLALSVTTAAFESLGLRYVHLYLVFHLPHGQPGGGRGVKLPGKSGPARNGVYPPVGRKVF